ncbi:MAG: AAA family ATPase [Treponema sp.]|nr:AAA family ATPase [Treponema sp.]
MYRKAYQNLLQWKNEEKGSCAIMIDGARRVGKSYLAQEFAKNEYESYILIDFFTAPDEVKELFEKYLSDLDTLFMRLSAYYSIRLHERNRLSPFHQKKHAGHFDSFGRAAFEIEPDGF